MTQAVTLAVDSKEPAARDERTFGDDILNVIKSAPRYCHMVIAGQVVSTPVDQVRYTDNGRIILPSH